jgi:hypothetical protein
MTEQDHDPSTIYSYAQKCGLLKLRKNSDVEAILESFIGLIKADISAAVSNEQVFVLTNITPEQKLYFLGLNDGIAKAVKAVKNSFLPETE